MKKNNYDVIVIGSGIGGLSAASILAQMNKKRVLVLEKHSTPGGQTHTFSRKGENKYTWDVGLHYCSGFLEEGKINRNLFDYITGGKLKWNRIPEPYDIFVYPDYTFSVPDDWKEYRNSIIELYPQERKAIEKYFKDIKKIARWCMMWPIASNSPANVSLQIKSINSFSSSIALSTTAEYLNKNIKDHKLKVLLFAQGMCCGILPDQCAFAMHAMLICGFF